MTSPNEILSFWLDEIGPAGWYESSEALDQTIRDRFLPAWEKAMDGGYGHWLSYASGTLAYIILLDQFPRNMFRGNGRSFASDRVALAAAKAGIHQKFDLKIHEPARQFFYLPLMHSENLCDQERCIRMMMQRMPEGGPGNLLHARAHREVIRKFGRFPYRNDALERPYTGPERAYVDGGGYGETVREMQDAEAA